MFIELDPEDLEHLELVLRDRVTAQIDIAMAACEEGDPDHAACHLLDAQLTQDLERAVRAAQEDDHEGLGDSYQAPPAPAGGTPTATPRPPTGAFDLESLGIKVYGRSGAGDVRGTTPDKP